MLQYDVGGLSKPRRAGQAWLGGALGKGPRDAFPGRRPHLRHPGANGTGFWTGVVVGIRLRAVATEPLAGETPCEERFWERIGLFRG
ncbi:MAG: hypothetical protein HUU20_03980 [Pirellulales bacterium]|nr:hypothetical protein [Pirellulales bacterium]